MNAIWTWLVENMNLETLAVLTSALLVACCGWMTECWRRRQAEAKVAGLELQISMQTWKEQDLRYELMTQRHARAKAEAQLRGDGRRADGEGV